ncbi:PREDICTED: uncharacterized protein LOC109231567 [Nicotiana attenuata]|uniref:uncharacterized protein LOC109231567 n=1 Tax=Nicotiana attenuata TaxID=49451 RepID=UPI000905C257|nr:PREDICTED: uncharacterized protein LOC109231567 [Nicotiana attenuata]
MWAERQHDEGKGWLPRSRNEECEREEQIFPPPKLLIANTEEQTRTRRRKPNDIYQQSKNRSATDFYSMQSHGEECDRIVQNLEAAVLAYANAWRELLPTMLPVPWKCLMFKNDARPKAGFTMWLQLHRRLATTDRLVNWGLAVDTTCTLCQKQPETRENLFAEYEFTKAIWRKMQQWLQRLPTKGIQVQTWNQHS